MLAGLNQNARLLGADIFKSNGGISICDRSSMADPRLVTCTLNHCFKSASRILKNLQSKLSRQALLQRGKAGVRLRSA